MKKLGQSLHKLIRKQISCCMY